MKKIHLHLITWPKTRKRPLLVCAGQVWSRASIAVVVVTAVQIPQLPEVDIALEMQIFIGDETNTFELNRDCRYTGGVNCSPDSDSEHSGSSWSDTKTLAELDGEELEEHLQMLLAEELQNLEGLANASKYSQIAAPKSDKVWKKSEKNQALGYTGSLQCTWQWNDKASQDQADLHKKAQTLWVIFSVLSALINNLCFSVMIHWFPWCAICLPQNQQCPLHSYENLHWQLFPIQIIP